MTDPTLETDEGRAPSFRDFELDPAIVEAVEALGFEAPTPIQAATFAPMLAGGDMIGRARTGSGKTAAFGLPLLQRVREGGGPVRALILCPTRELALQVTEALRDYAKKLPVRITTIYGGVPYRPQLDALKRGVPVVVGTPGRVLDHVDRGSLDLSQLELLVLDEADEMLRMGFIDDVERVFAASPDDRQVALFSATMPDPIRRLASTRLREPQEIQVEDTAMHVDHIQQTWIKVAHREKVDALARVLAGLERGATLVFARTRAGCAEVADMLAKRGLPVDALHGDLNQAARERVLARFRAGRLDVVIATDVAARGIDVAHITHVINLDMPDDTETYVHRIGRTGRAGREGNAISFVTSREIPRLKRLRRDLGAEVVEIDVPGDEAILRAQDRILEKRLIQAMDEHLEGVRTIIGRMLEQGFDPRDLAAAALGMVAATSTLDPSTLPPVGKKRRRMETPPDHEFDAELFLPVGKDRGVRKGDLVGALANETGIPGARIGRVTVLGRKSFIALSRADAERILASHSSLEIRGRNVPLHMARAREDRPPLPHPRRGPRPPRFRRGGPGRGSRDR
jgi:ATP-dependent RNA helicase DeaD